MNAHDPLMQKIASVKDALHADKDGIVQSIVQSDAKADITQRIHSAIDDMKWLLERISADGPEPVDPNHLMRT